MSGPDCRESWIFAAKSPDRVVDGEGGEAGVRRGGAVIGEVVVNAASDVAGCGVADGPKGSDDVLIASQVEGASDMDGLVGQRGTGDGGVTSRQEGEAAGDVESADVSDRQRPVLVVVEDELAGSGVGPVGISVAGEMSDPSAR